MKNLEKINNETPLMVDVPLYARLRSARVKVEEVRETFSELAFMLQSGIPLFTSLGIISEHIKQNELKRIVDKIRFDLSEGKTLSVSMKAYPNAFNSVQTSMILIGEASGNLDEALDDLVKMIDDERDLRDEIRKAVAYPIFMLCMSVLLVFSMLLFTFPRFQKLFQSFKAKLPFMTTLLMSLSDWMVSHIALIIVGLAIVPISIFTIQHISSLRFLWDRYKFKIPIFGKLFQGQVLARFGRIMGSLLSTGVPLVESLQLYRDVVSNLYLKQSMDRIIAEVKEGIPLSTAVSKCALFSPLVIQLIRTGENTGDLDKMIKRIFIFYRKRLSVKIKQLVTVLEPLLLAVMGGLVAMMAICIMLPLFKLASHVRGVRG